MINLENYEMWFLDFLEDRLSSKQVLLLNQFLEDHSNLKLELEEMTMVFVNPENIEYKDKLNLRKEIDPSNELEDFIISKMEGDMPENNIPDFEYLIRKENEASEIVNSFVVIKSDSVAGEMYPDKSLLHKQAYTLDDIDTLILASLDGSISDYDAAWLKNNFSDKALKSQLRKFKEIRLVVDESIVFNGKDELKKDITRIVPLYWMKRVVGIAASLLLLVMINNWDINSIGDNFKKPLVIEQVIESMNPKEERILVDEDNNNSMVEELINGIDNKIDKSRPSTIIKTIINDKPNLKHNEMEPLREVQEGEKNLNNDMNVTIIAKEIAQKAYLGNINQKNIDKVVNQYYVQKLDRLSVSDITSGTAFLGVKMPSIIAQSIPTVKKLNIDKPQINIKELKLGDLEVDMPDLLASGYESVKNSKKAFDSGKKKGRSVFSFSIGNFSVYRSKSKED